MLHCFNSPLQLSEKDLELIELRTKHFKEVASLQGSQSKLEKEVRGLSEENRDLRKNLESLLQELRGARGSGRVGTPDMDAEDVVIISESVISSSSEGDGEDSDLASENGRLQARIVELEQELTQSQDEKASLKGRLEELSQEVVRLEDDVQAKTQALHRLNTECQELRSVSAQESASKSALEQLQKQVMCGVLTFCTIHFVVTPCLCPLILLCECMRNWGDMCKKYVLVWCSSLCTHVCKSMYAWVGLGAQLQESEDRLLNATFGRQMADKVFFSDAPFPPHVDAVHAW